MRRSALTTLSTLLAFTVLVAAGCGGGGGSSKGTGASAITSAPVGSQAPAAFRELARGDRTGYTTIPADMTREVVASTAVEFSALWVRHMTGAHHQALPTIDFAAERVVAVFLGERPSVGFGIEVVSIADVGSGAAGVEVGYVTTRPTGQPTGQPTRPFHFVAINRTAGTVTFKDVTQAAVTTPLADVHGTLVVTPLKAGTGTALAFLEDGKTDAREVADTTALVAAGARAGATLLVTGDAESNRLGATALPEAVRVASFSLDDVAVTGRLEQVPGGRLLRDEEGTIWEPIGPLAASLAQAPVARPLRVTGRKDPAHRSAIGATAGLVVTSQRATVTLSVRIAGGLAGADRLTAIDDLPRTGAYRFHDELVIAPQNDRSGRGSLSAAQKVDVEAKLGAANLRAQPTTFRPAVPILDAPQTVLKLADAQGDVTITIQAGATLPPAVEALLVALRDVANATATMKALAKGTTSGVAQAGVRVAKDAAAYQALWAAHAGTGPGAPAAPAVDFTKSVVVGVFQGRQSSGGYAIEVKALERKDAEVHLTIVRTTPAPGTPVTLALTAPYHLIVVDHQGATGDVWADGKKQ